MEAWNEGWNLLSSCGYPWGGGFTPGVHGCSHLSESFSWGVPCVPGSQKSTEGIGKAPNTREKQLAVRYDLAVVIPLAAREGKNQFLSNYRGGSSPSPFFLSLRDAYMG